MKAIDVVVFQEFINQYRQSQEERASKGLGLQYFRPQELQLLLNKIPTIEVEPVRHGRWVKANGMMPPEYHGRKCCSVCGAFALSDFYGRERLSDFCPNCGAKMDAKEEQTNE